MGCESITVVRGTVVKRRIKLRDGISATLVNLNGATIESEVKLTPGAADPALATGTVIILDQDLFPGEFEISFSAIQTDALGAGTFSYDVMVTVNGNRHAAIPPSPFRVIAAVNLL